MGEITTDNPKGAGRHSILTKELLADIKEKTLEGNNLTETANLCEISWSTFSKWHADNYEKLADLIEGWKRDRRLAKALENIDEIQEMEIENTGVTQKGEEFTFKDAKILKVKADVATFITETLAKKIYSKRSEITGADGEPLTVQVIKYDDNPSSIPIPTESLPTAIPKGDGQGLETSSPGVESENRKG